MGIMTKQYTCKSCGLTLTERGAENCAWECPRCGRDFEGAEDSNKITGGKEPKKQRKEGDGND